MASLAIQAALRALRSAHLPRLYVPSLIEDPSLNRACGQLIFLCLFLSSGTILAFFCSVAPTISQLHLPSILDESERLFPAGIELELDNGTLKLRPHPDPIAKDDEEPGKSEYVCWAQEAEKKSWCATAPLLEPIELTLSPLLHDAYFRH